MVDEEMDGVAREQRKRLETIDTELEEVKRRLGRIWHFIETTDTDMADNLETCMRSAAVQECGGGGGLVPLKHNPG